MVDECYPPIRYRCKGLIEEGKDLLAVIVEPDFLTRPHFVEPGYVRVGSESLPAKESLFDEVIATRESKARDLLKAKTRGEMVSLTRCLFGFNDHSMRATPVDAG